MKSNQLTYINKINNYFGSHVKQQGESHFSNEIIDAYENILLKFVILPVVVAISIIVIVFCFLLLNYFKPEWCKSYKWVPSTKTTYIILVITIILICIFISKLPVPYTDTVKYYTF